MDIRSLLASRTRWQPATETAATKASQGVADTGTSTGPSSTSGVSGDTSKTGQNGGVTGTGGSTLGPLTALAMPSADSVAADKKQLGDELSMTLAIAGIKTSPPIEFSTDPSGNVTVSDSDPRAGDIRKALDNQPELKQRLNKLVSDAQLMEHGDAVLGWYKQVNAGTSGTQANKNLIAAAERIDAAKGFTLNSEGLTLDVEGLGAKLMQPDKVPPSDDEKMWRETLRLTNRASGGVVAAAAQDREREAAESRNPEPSTKGSNVTTTAEQESDLQAAQRRNQARQQGLNIGDDEDKRFGDRKDGTEAEQLQKRVNEIFRKTSLGLAAIGPAPLPATPAETGEGATAPSGGSNTAG
ncbi:MULTISPECIES: hypothetical protein [unclassified Azospirillum]|uniref:hypothetical protein n=1 Tax=unclassified Azospirillum TaxID=2630922 RepID=UPI000B715770|nr:MULTISPECIES: hypothetical protein [unclassified Azospirillum]SNR84608.1 hypothetical protein SAMN05880556_10188 [Azospirillum sp. RU38E]SNS00337.1 hypothetical protein SAMN05880591_10188 [Azospirillum sp. RU37A]